MRAGLRGCITWSTAGSCRKFLARKGLVSWLFPWGLWGASEEASAEDRPVSGRGLEHRTSHGQTASLRVCGPAGRGCLGAHWTGCWKTQRRSERGQGRWVFPGIRAPPLSDPEAPGSATVLGSLPRLVRSDRHPLPRLLWDQAAKIPGPPCTPGPVTRGGLLHFPVGPAPMTTAPAPLGRRGD